MEQPGRGSSIHWVSGATAAVLEEHGDSPAGAAAHAALLLPDVSGILPSHSASASGRVSRTH